MDPAEQTNQSTLPETKTEAKPQEKELFSWVAPSRPFKRRNREFYITVIAMAAIVGLILLLTEGFMPVILLVSLVFLFYVLNTVEPENIQYKITNLGIKVDKNTTLWEYINNFWFSRRYDSTLLIIGISQIPGRMELVINEEDKEKITSLLKEKVPEEEIPPSYLDKAANWFAKKLPGNN